MGKEYSNKTGRTNQLLECDKKLGSIIPNIALMLTKNARLFENKMEYILEQPKPGHLRLKEALTQSVVRLQTSDRMLAETFWNHYHYRDLSGRGEAGV